MSAPLDHAPIEHWPPRLEAALAAHPSIWRRVTVLRETESTQDAARRQGARPGDVVVAWRQLAGRGRLGRRWIDTGRDGVAMTFVISAGPAERLAIAAAVGAAAAIEALLPEALSPRIMSAPPRVGIKWPNDLVIEARKLAGILVEQTGDVALIGIGINVGQRHWPGELADRAVSLAQLGASVDRVLVIERVLQALPAALALDEPQLAAEFSARDVLCGHTAAFITDEGAVTGRVERIDPLRGLVVATSAGDVWLRAAVTTVIRWKHAGQTHPRAVSPVDR